MRASYRLHDASRMQFTREQPGEINLVRSYAADEVRIGERVLRGSCVLAPRELLVDWAPQNVEELLPEHFAAVLAWQPEIILLGTGLRQHFPKPGIFAAIQSRGIGFEVMDSGAACRTYNVLASEGRKVAVGLLIGRN